MACPRCGTPSAGDNYCAGCLDTVMENIQLRAENIHNNLIYWITEAEKNYRTKIWYSEDLPLHTPHRNTGTAEGFLPIFGKDFRLRGNYSPSHAIRTFIDGTGTICECEVLLLAVVFNAVLDVVSVPVFDRVFAGLELLKGGGITMKFTEIVGTDEGGVKLGDMVYLVNKQRLAVAQYAQDGLVSSAAQGWNLICVDPHPPKRYMG